MKNILLGHTSFETAYKVENYPYGFRLKTTMHYWIESTPKKGDRFCTCTINPKNDRLNATKKSTYVAIGCMFLNDIGHVVNNGIGIYTEKEKVTAFIDAIGIDNLNPEQKKMYNQLMGINEVKTDEFTGKVKKDFAVKWEKDREGNCDEVRITFDRPDGVMLKEIFAAMESLNQEKLNQVFVVRESKQWGNHPGTVRICCRGGVQITTVRQESYLNYLASDARNNAIEA